MLLTIAIILLSLCRPCFHFFSLTMSLHQWNTSFERKQLAKVTTSLALYQANNGSSEMEEDVMSALSSSSATSSSASSSSSSSSSDMDLDQTTLIDPVLFKLIVTTTTLNENINGIVCDDGIATVQVDCYDHHTKREY